MPENICENKSLDACEYGAQAMFLRLLAKVDGLGRYHADPVLLRAHLFPFNEHVTNGLIRQWRDNLRDWNVIALYEVGADPYLLVVDYQAAKNVRAKFPDPIRGKGKPGQSVAASRKRTVSGNGGQPVPAGNDSEQSVPDVPHGNIREQAVPKNPLCTDARAGPPKSSEPRNLDACEKSLRIRDVKDTYKTRNVVSKSGGIKSNVARAFARRCGGNIDDLTRDDFVDQCFHIAVEFNVVPESDGGRQTVFAAAEQCLDSGKHMGLFFHILTAPDGRSRITESSDEGARARVARFYRGESPRRRSPLEDVE